MAAESARERAVGVRAIPERIRSLAARTASVGDAVVITVSPNENPPAESVEGLASRDVYVYAEAARRPQRAAIIMLGIMDETPVNIGTSNYHGSQTSVKDSPYTAPAACMFLIASSS